MNPIALSLGNISIYYSGIVIAFGTASCLCLTWALFVSHEGQRKNICLFVPIALTLSVFLSRVLHWYCHTEQYMSFISAVTDYGTGDFVLSGVFIGLMITYALLSIFCNKDQLSLLLDCLALGIDTFIISVRLSCIFNSAFRSKISVNEPSFQHLPLAAVFYNSSGSVEYRLAAFFIEAILLALLLILLLVFFSKIRNTPAKKGMSNSGGVWLMFILWYSVIEVVMDSTRYDSSFVPFNGFVSVVQTFCGAMMLAVLIYYSIRSAKADGLKLYHWLIWAGWFISLGGAGISEYLVQRHGDWYLSCYFLMSICLVIMAVLTVSMYKYQCNIHSSEET
ncbi:MAG: prolipoprotein diacylglyceryl transferase [Oscillospiraceae bacterium]|nr:prolipoprotein diacylglyceryl transferase [Oscillospiraceae bacterium]